jgi:hypothetical protein
LLSYRIDGRAYDRKDAMLEGAMHTKNCRQVGLVQVEGRGPDDAAAVREKVGLELGSRGGWIDILLFLRALDMMQMLPTVGTLSVSLHMG